MTLMRGWGNSVLPSYIHSPRDASHQQAAEATIKIHMMTDQGLRTVILNHIDRGEEKRKEKKY
jgi:hypothetical protein